MFIRWGNSCSDKFYDTNGVKQGGILSPALFIYNSITVYNQSGIGGSLGDNLINDILSSSGKQHLLDSCDLYVTNNQLSYNTTKLFF